MQPWDLASRVTPGREVVIQGQGSYRGMKGRVVRQLTPSDCDEAITGMCAYELDLGHRDANGDRNVCDFRRYEFKVRARERALRRG